jgi:hypothetical protein
MSVPNLLLTVVPLAVVLGLVSLVVARAVIHSRELRDPGTWPHIARQLSRKQRASVRRALRNGQAADDPSLAFAVVAAARLLQRHGPTAAQRRCWVAVGVLLLAAGLAYGGWRAVVGPRDWMLVFIAVLLPVDGLLLIALVPISVRQAKRAAEAERANQALLDGS